MKILNSISVVVALKSIQSTSFLLVKPPTSFHSGGLRLSSENEPRPGTDTASDIVDVSSSLPSVQSGFPVVQSSGEIVQTPYYESTPQGYGWKSKEFSETPTLVTFDVVNTIVQLNADVGMFYREVLFEATNYNARLPRPDVFREAFYAAYREMDEKYPCFGCGAGMTSRDWWRTVVYDTYGRVDINEPGLRKEMDEWLLEEVFEALYADVFVTGEAWELRPGALEALSNFMLWRDKHGGPKLAVLSNYDERIHQMLANLDILEAFDFVLCSREIGTAKPDRRAFEVAMSRIGEINPKNCVHVGDSFEKDCLGAAKAGWHGVFIPKTGEMEIPQGDHTDLEFSVVNDIFAVLRMYGKEPEHRMIITTRPITERGNFAFHQKVWTEEEEEEEEWDTQKPFSLPPTERKSWEGPGRF